MATLNLTQCFVNRMSDGAYVAGYTVLGSREEGSAIDGEVRTYGVGRRRQFTVPGEKLTYKCSLYQVSRVDKETLKLWKGDLVSLRTNFGDRFVGTFFSVEAIIPIKDMVGFYQLGLTLNGLT